MKTTPFLPAALLAASLPSLVLAQGPLDPPTTVGPAGPIAPLDGGGVPQASMKTLHEVEPSRAVTATNTPGDASYEFIISQPGAYHLTANVLTFGKSAIQITASGVTLDLRGFQLWSFGSEPHGVAIGKDADRCTIKNGSIQDFDFGVFREIDTGDEAEGGTFLNLAVTGHSNIALLGGKGWTVNNCRVQGGGNTGISCGNGAVITNSTVTGMTGSLGTNGIKGGRGSVVQNCSVTSSTVIYGIRVDDGSVLENCAALENTGDSAIPFSYGIFAGSRCIVRGCLANDNAHSSNSIEAGAGIHAANYSSVIHCHANRNNGAGIIVDQASTVQSCKSHFNGRGGTGAGVHIRANAGGGWNRIIDNDLTFNVTGIDCDSTANFIVRNRSGGNSENYNIIADNRVGVIVIPANSGAITGPGTGLAAGVSTTDPWANSTY